MTKIVVVILTYNSHKPTDDIYTFEVLTYHVSNSVVFTFSCTRVWDIYFVHCICSRYLAAYLNVFHNVTFSTVVTIYNSHSCSHECIIISYFF
jgi:hypothetical protein